MKFLDQQGYLDATTQTYKAFGEAAARRTYTNALLKAGFGNRFRSVPLDRRHDGGADLPADRRHGSVSEGLRARDWQPEASRFGAEVSRSTRTPRASKVAYLDTKSGKKTELTADFVAVCLPMPIVAKLDIKFSPEMMAAARRWLPATARRWACR